MSIKPYVLIEVNGGIAEEVVNTGANVEILDWDEVNEGNVDYMKEFLADEDFMMNAPIRTISDLRVAYRNHISEHRVEVL